MASGRPLIGIAAWCKQRRDRLKAEGRCIQCAQPVTRYARCLRCRRYMARKARLFRQKAAA